MSAWSGTEQAAVERQLAPGERIEWIGRPDRKKLFSLAPVDEINILFFGSIFAATIVLEVLGAIYGPKDSWTVSVFVFCTFSMFSGLLAFGPILRRAYRKRRAVYAVTIRRALVIVGRDTVNAANLDALPRVSPNTDDFGKGTLYFEISREGGPPLGFSWHGPGASTSGFRDVWRVWPPSSAFYDIDYPSEVAKLIKRLRDEDGAA